VFVAAGAAALAADLWTKHEVFERLLDDPSLPARVRALAGEADVPADGVLGPLRIQRRVMPGVKLTLSTNPGVVFGLPMPRWAVAVATVLTIAMVMYFFATSDARALPVHAALALVLAGALGNLYDRLFSTVVVPGLAEPIRRQVRDFIDCTELCWLWVFNVADVWLVVGVAGLILHWYAAGRRDRQAGKAA
jgi:signal peptidase II